MFWMKIYLNAHGIQKTASLKEPPEVDQIFWEERP